MGCSSKPRAGKLSPDDREVTYLQQLGSPAMCVCMWLCGSSSRQADTRTVTLVWADTRTVALVRADTRTVALVRADTRTVAIVWADTYRRISTGRHVYRRISTGRHVYRRITGSIGCRCWLEACSSE